MARKSRVIVLAVWATIALVLFFGFRGNKQADLERYKATLDSLKNTADDSVVPDSASVQQSKSSKEQEGLGNSFSENEDAEDDEQVAIKARPDSLLAGERPPSKDKTNEALTKEEGEPFNPKTEYEAILGHGPVVIFSKSYCPYSKAAKEILLNEYQIIPTPVVVELDLHPHGPELQQYIGQVTGRRTVPNVHVNGVSRGGGDDFRALAATGRLLAEMQAWSESKFSVTKNVKPE